MGAKDKLTKLARKAKNAAANAASNLKDTITGSKKEEPKSPPVVAQEEEDKASEATQMKNFVADDFPSVPATQKAPPPLVVPPTITQAPVRNNPNYHPVSSVKPKNEDYGSIVALPDLPPKEMARILKDTINTGNAIIKTLRTKYDEMVKASQGTITPNMRGIESMIGAIDFAVGIAIRQQDEEANLKQTTQELMSVILKQEKVSGARSAAVSFRYIKSLIEEAKTKAKNAPSVAASSSSATSSSVNANVYAEASKMPQAQPDNIIVGNHAYSFNQALDRFIEAIKHAEVTDKQLEEFCRINPLRKDSENAKNEMVSLRLMLLNAQPNITDTNKPMTDRAAALQNALTDYEKGLNQIFTTYPQALTNLSSNIDNNPISQGYLGPRHEAQYAGASTSLNPATSSGYVGGTANPYQSFRAILDYDVPATETKQTLQKKFISLIEGARADNDKLKALGSISSELDIIRENLSNFIANAKMAYSGVNPDTNQNIELKAINDSYKTQLNNLDTISQAFTNLTNVSLAANFTKDQITKNINDQKAALTLAQAGTKATNSGKQQPITGAYQSTSSIAASSSTTNPNSEPVYAAGSSSLPVKTKLENLFKTNEGIIIKLQGIVKAEEIYNGLRILNANIGSTILTNPTELLLTSYNDQFKKTAERFREIFPTKDINQFTAAELNPNATIDNSPDTRGYLGPSYQAPSNNLKSQDNKSPPPLLSPQQQADFDNAFKILDDVKSSTSTNSKNAGATSSGTNNQPGYQSPNIQSFEEIKTQIDVLVAAGKTIIENLQGIQEASAISSQLTELNTSTNSTFDTTYLTLSEDDIAKTLAKHQTQFNAIKNTFKEKFPGLDIDKFTAKDLQDTIAKQKTTATFENEKKELLSHEEKIKTALTTLEAYPPSIKKSHYTNTFKNAQALIAQIKNNEAVDQAELGKTLRRTKITLGAYNDNAYELAHPRKRAASVSEVKLPTLNKAKREFIDTLNTYVGRNDVLDKNIDTLKQNTLAVVQVLTNNHLNIAKTMEFLTKSTADINDEEIKSKFENFKKATDREIARIRELKAPEEIDRYRRITLPNLIFEARRFNKDNATHTNVANLKNFIIQAETAIQDPKTTVAAFSALMHNIRAQMKPSGPAPDGKEKEAIKKLQAEIDKKLEDKKTQIIKDKNTKINNIKINLESDATTKIEQVTKETQNVAKNTRARLNEEATNKKNEINNESKTKESTASLDEKATALKKIAEIDATLIADIKKVYITANAEIEKATAEINANLEANKKIEELGITAESLRLTAKEEAIATIEKAKADPNTNIPDKLKAIEEKALTVADRASFKADQDASNEIAKEREKAIEIIKNKKTQIDNTAIANKKQADIALEGDKEREIKIIDANTAAAKAKLGTGTDYEKEKAAIIIITDAAIKNAEDEAKTAIQIKKLELENRLLNETTSINIAANDAISKKTKELKDSATAIIKSVEAKFADNTAKLKDGIDKKTTEAKLKADANPATADKVKAALDAKAKKQIEKIERIAALDLAKEINTMQSESDIAIKKFEIEEKSKAEIKIAEKNAIMVADLAKASASFNEAADIKIIDLKAGADIRISNANPDPKNDDAAKQASEHKIGSKAGDEETTRKAQTASEIKAADKAYAETIANETARIEKELPGKIADDKDIKRIQDDANKKTDDFNADLAKIITTMDQAIADIDKSIADLSPPIIAPKLSPIAEHTKKLDDTQAALEKASKALGKAFAETPDSFFSGKDDLEDKASRFSKLMRDLRKSPNLQQHVEEVIQKANNHLGERNHKLFGKNENLKNAFDDFMAASLAHLENIKVQRDNYHATFNVEQSYIATLDSKKPDIDVYNENKSKVGITSDPVTNAPHIELNSGSTPNNPSVAERINSNQMRICSIKTKNDEMLGYVETFKMNTARSAVYEMPPSLLSVESLLKKHIINQRDNLGIPDKVSNEQLEAVFKQMLPLMTSKTFESESKLKDVIKAGLNQVGVELSTENYKAVTYAIRNTYTANQQQTYNGVNFPHDDLIRLAVSQVNGIKQMRPDPKVPIHINKAPSPDYVRAVMLFAMANDYKVSNNSTFKNVKPPSKSELEAFKVLVHTHKLHDNQNRFGAETLAPAKEHLENFGKMNKR